MLNNEVKTEPAQINVASETELDTCDGSVNLTATFTHFRTHPSKAQVRPCQCNIAVFINDKF